MNKQDFIKEWNKGFINFINVEGESFNEEVWSKNVIEGDNLSKIVLTTNYRKYSAQTLLDLYLSGKLKAYTIVQVM